MPKVKYTAAKGLVQSSGSGVSFAGNSLAGAPRTLISLTGAGATATLTAEDTGCVVKMGGSNASTVTLPAVAAGLSFRFVAVTAHAHVITGGAAVIEGGYHHNSNGGTVARVAIVNKTTITLHNSNSAIADTLECWSDGTSWYMSGIVNDAITQNA
jgi:hypothetical protein